MNVRTRWKDLDDTEKDNVLKAVKALNDPKSSPAARRVANDIIEKYKVK